MNKAILCLVSVVCFAVPAVGCGGGASSSHAPYRQVDVLSNTQFETEEDQMVSGLSSFKTGDTVSVSGLLFNTMTTPTMVPEKVVSGSTSSGSED